MENVIVGIAEYKIVKAPMRIMTIGLGSCCGVVLYDEINKIAGLVHVLLADSSCEKLVINKAKYADTGIEILYEDMKRNGANPAFIKAKIAGGAHMFNFKSGNNSIFTIGEKNVMSCKKTLKKLNIPIISEDVLGTSGRTIVFDIMSSKLKVKSVGKIEKMI